MIFQILNIIHNLNKFIPGIFIMSFLTGVIRLPLLCKSGISFISASFHLEELTIAIATSLNLINYRLLHIRYFPMPNLIKLLIDMMCIVYSILLTCFRYLWQDPDCCCHRHLSVLYLHSIWSGGSLRPRDLSLTPSEVVLSANRE